MAIPEGLLIFHETGAYMTVRVWYKNGVFGGQELNSRGIDTFENVWQVASERADFEAMVLGQVGQSLTDIRGHVALETGERAPQICLFTEGPGSDLLVARDITQLGNVGFPAHGVYSFGNGALLTAFHEHYGNGNIPGFETLLQGETTLQPVFASLTISSGAIGGGGFGDSTNAGNSTNQGNAGN